MTTAQLVRKLLEAGATPEVVEICLTAIEEARDPPPRRHRRKEGAPRGEVVDLRR
jgi:hypothetical protein